MSTFFFDLPPFSSHTLDRPPCKTGSEEPIPQLTSLTRAVRPESSPSQTPGVVAARSQSTPRQRKRLPRACRQPPSLPARPQRLRQGPATGRPRSIHQKRCQIRPRLSAEPSRLWSKRTVEECLLQDQA